MFEDGVASHVAVFVVDLLEQVDVGNDQCHLAAVAAPAAVFLIEPVVVGVPVGDVGERVGGGASALFGQAVAQARGFVFGGAQLLA